jgi:MFS family permease
MVQPIMPLYMRGYGASIVLTGVLNAAFGVGLVIFDPLWGWLFDKTSKKKILSLASLFMSLNMFLYVLVREAWMFLPLRFFDGILMSALGVTTRGLTASFSRNRGRGYGLWFAMWSISILIGSPLGGYLAGTRGYPTPFLAGVIAAIIGFFVSFWITEPKRTIDVVTLKQMNLRVLFVTSFLITFYFFGLGSLNYILPVHAYESPKFLASETEIGLIFALMAAVGIPARLSLGVFSDRIGRKSVIILGIILCGLTFLVLPLNSSLRQLYVSIAFFSIGGAAIAPSMLSLLVDKVSASSQGRAIGIYQASEDLGFLFGPLIGSYVYQYFGSSSYFHLCATLMLLVFVFALVLFRKI